MKVNSNDTIVSGHPLVSKKKNNLCMVTLNDSEVEGYYWSPPSVLETESCLEWALYV